MRMSHKRPRNEQDFEQLCLKLLRTYWKCPELRLYAARGEAQHGVDIVDLSGQEPLRAAQCKLHEEGKVTIRSEVKREIEKAKGFAPPLGRYVIMTTGKVKKEVHDLLIEINREHRKKKLFIVEVFDWGRIEELLDEYTNVGDRYEGHPPSPAVGRIESKIETLLQLTEQNSGLERADERRDGFHAEIDEARNSIDQHDYQIAKLLLQRIKLRSWDKLNARHKFRMLTNLASIEVSADNLNGAAALYFEAKKHQPDDEVARTNEAIGYWMLGRHERAFVVARKLREDFPRSERVLGIFIQSAPESMALQLLEGSVPEDLFHKDEVAIALAQRAEHSGDFQKAEEFIRAATNADSRASMTWLLLGGIIFQSEVSRSYESHGTEALFCDEDRLREAEDALGRALIRAKEERSTPATVEALLNRSQTRFVLKKDVEAREDLEEARRIAPEHPRVIEKYGQSLRIEGKSDAAIDFMRRVPEEELSDNGRMMLGMLLMERGGPNDYRSAGDLLSQVAKSAARLPDDFREHAIDIGLEAFGAQGRIDAGHKLLAAIPEGTISGVAFKTLTARLHLLEGQQDEASKSADEALAITGHVIKASDVRRLALLLYVLGRFNDALPLWQRISAPGVLSADTRYLLECADRLNRHEIMLHTFGRLRETGAIDRTLLDSELSFLEMYDTDVAIKILNEEIIQRPDDTELKLRRSMLGLALDRADLVDQAPSSVPKADEVTPRTAGNAVRVLRAIGHEQDAVQYAYDVIRHNFQEPDAHRAFILALAPFPTKPELEQPDCVETGAAVCYVEQGASFPYWIIVEDPPDPNSQFPERELSPNDEICKAMMGKNVGDTFLLAKGIQDRIGEIREIQNKYVHRYQDCMGQWQVRFPGLADFQVVKGAQKTGESDGSELDMSAILKSADERHEHVSKMLDIYKESLLTLHILGERFGVTAYEALWNLATTPDVPVRCCIGSREEREHAAKALRSCNTVVLDMSAISSLVLLDKLDILKEWPTDLVVSKSTVNEIRQMIANESLLGGQESGVLIKTETGLALQERTTKQKEAYIKSLRHLVEMLEENCKIDACKSLAAMEPEKREILVKGFGQYGAEAILLSAAPGAVLWTDDYVQAGLARGAHGVQQVWTQFVIGACAESGLLGPEAFLDASARLFGYGYHFTSNNPQIVRQAGVIANWKVDGWPLSQLLSAFAQEDVDLMHMLQLAGEFFSLLYQESVLPQTKVNITVKILENIARREGGIQGIRGLPKALPILFRVNVVGLADATATIEAWLRTA